MNEPHDTSDNLHVLRRQAHLNGLKLKVARQDAALAALQRVGRGDSLEGYYDPSNCFDPRDYLFETPAFGGAIPTTLNDRDQGRDYPIFRTEQELAVIRGAARLLTAANPIASGLLSSLTNYVIGTGFQYVATPRNAGAIDLAKLAAEVIEEFLDDNNWLGDLDRELFQRSRVDGEYFLGLWHVGKGRVQVRAIEPDQVTEPSNQAGLDAWLGCKQPTNWTFGVQTDDADAQAIHGYFVKWSNRDQDWDYLPGGNEPILPPDSHGFTWLAHAKLNVVRSVKRGLSDFYPIQGNLDIARRVLRNMGEGSAVQAAIAWIQEVAPGTTQAQAHSGTLSRADASYTTRTAQGSDRTHYVQQYDPATILKVPSGQKYLPGPLAAQNAASFISAAEALLRSVAVRWNLPENFVTGSAANNNFASSLVAETPFVKYAESQQQFYVQRDRKTLERVLWMAWQAGRFGDVPWDAIKRNVNIVITPPQIEARDPQKETQVRKTLFEAGVLSKKTWAAQEGLDFEQEQKNLQMEAEAAKKANPQTEEQPVEHRKTATHLLEEPPWDPAKHPRNEAGEFVETGRGSNDEGERTNARFQLVGDPTPKRKAPTLQDRNRLMSELTHDPEFAARNSRINAIHSAAKLPAEVVAAAMKGAKTGVKANVNGFATTVKNVATLGLNDKQIELIGVSKEDRANGYDTAVAITTASGQILIGVGTGGLATALSKGGVIARSAGGLLLVYDAAGNAVGVVEGAVDVANKGEVNLQNGTQILGSALGLAGNAKALKGLKGGRAGADAATVGRRLGTVMEKAELDALEKTLLKRPKVTTLARNQDKALPKNVGAKFTPYRDGSSRISLKGNPTVYEVQHELAHLDHFETLGYDLARWSGQTRLQREQYAYDLLRKSTWWAKFSAQEQKHAKDYIKREGGNAW